MTAPTLPTDLPRCPVCGEALTADVPRHCCERCDTPHHPECWEYVPGCAVFGCAEGGALALPTEDWPELHRLLLSGTRWIGASAASLQMVVVTFLGSILWLTATQQPAIPIWLWGPFLASIVSTLACMYGAFRVKWAVQARGGFEQLEAVAAEGDRRLARAVAERTGRTLPLSPGCATLLALGAVAVAFFVPLAASNGVSPVILIGMIGEPHLLAQFLVMTFALYGALKLPTRWVGYQRILANRFGAALEASQPQKQLEAGDDG